MSSSTFGSGSPAGGGDAADASLPPSTGDASLSLGDDGQSCASSGGFDAVPGCACAPIGQSAPCWTGPASERHMGACHDGTAQCAAGGEFARWGPCEGEVLDCGDASPAQPEASAPPPPAPDAGACLPPDGAGRCPAGYTPGPVNLPPCFPFCDGGILIPTAQCCPCTKSDCDPSKPGGAACCVADVCGGVAECATCSGGALDPACKGFVDSDCDDFPEDCDQLCCPCKPAGVCPPCPHGQISCNGACVDGVGDPSHCGACDRACGSGQSCVSGTCQ